MLSKVVINDVAMDKRQYLLSLPRVSSRMGNEVSQVVAKLGLPSTLSVNAAVRGIHALQTAYSSEDGVRGLTVAVLRDFASWFNLEVDPQARKPALLAAVAPLFLSVNSIRVLSEEAVRNAPTQVVREWCAMVGLFDDLTPDECVTRLLQWMSSSVNTGNAPEAASSSSSSTAATMTTPAVTSLGGESTQSPPLQPPVTQGVSQPPVSGTTSPAFQGFQVSAMPASQGMRGAATPGTRETLGSSLHLPNSPLGSNQVESCSPVSFSDANFLDRHELLYMSRFLTGGPLPPSTSRADIMSALLRAGLVSEPMVNLPRSAGSGTLASGHGPAGGGDMFGGSSSRGFVLEGPNVHTLVPSQVEDTRVLSLLTRNVPNRLSDLLGPQGKYGSDAACGNCQVFMHPDDRRVLGVQKSHLKFLLGLLFVMDFSGSASPSGTHIQAFGSRTGEKFRHVYQVHTAVSRLTRILDSLLCAEKGPFLFQSILDPMLRLLQSGDICGLQKLPVDAVVDAVSEALMKLGHVARSAHADSWSLDVLKEKLSTAAHIDVSLVIQRASLLNLSHVRDQPRESGRKRVRSPEVSHRRSTVSSRQSNGGGVGRDSKRQTRHNVCLAALRKHLRLSDRGCEKPSCAFDHDLSKVSKATMLDAADSFFKADIRNKAKAAINALHGTPVTPTSSIESVTIQLTPAASRSALQRGGHSVQFVCLLAPIVLGLWLPVHGRNSSATLGDVTLLQDLVMRCISEFSPTRSIAAAREAAAGFQFPLEARTRDKLDLLRAGSLEGLVRTRQQERALFRFNVERCRVFLSQDEEFSTLLRIATTGVHIPVTTNFIPQSSPPPQRHLHSQLMHVYRLHAYQLWSAGHALLIPTSDLGGYRVHFNPAHWTSKPGKPLGRFLCDCSNGRDNSTLNADSLKSTLALQLGELYHPTIVEIVDMIIHFAEREGDWNELVLWKEDIAGAFSHFNYAPEDASLLAIQIDEEFTLVHISGMFGWTGSPYAFGPLSRALHRLISKRIAGAIRVYVDDFMGVSTSQSALRDQQLTQETLVAVLGDDAVNIEKSALPSRTAEFIGWYIDLDSQSVRPNDRGIRKLTAVLFDHDFSKSVKHPIDVYQKLASLTSRYSAALFAMRPFVHPFYSLTSGSGPRSSSSQARLAVLVWRTVCLRLLANPSSFCIPLRAMGSQSPLSGWVIISDAGPEGAGAALIAPGASNCWGYASYRFPFDARSSDYQNAREFLGLILGLLLCREARLQHVSVSWHGDNKSSLAWVRKRRSSSRFAQAAFFLYTWLCIMLNLDVTSTVHVPGVEMGNIDSLSRFKPHSLPEHLDLSSAIEDIATKLFTVCDPTTQCSEDVESHLHCFCSIARRVSSIISDA